MTGASQWALLLRPRFLASLPIPCDCWGTRKGRGPAWRGACQWGQGCNAPSITPSSAQPAVKDQGVGPGAELNRGWGGWGRPRKPLGNVTHCRQHLVQSSVCQCRGDKAPGTLREKHGAAMLCSETSNTAPFSKYSITCTVAGSTHGHTIKRGQQ
jgi:hypothetical protein